MKKAPASEVDDKANGNNDIVYSGLLRKKGGRVNVWSERYFVLRGFTLQYYVKPSDADPKGSFPLQATTQVSSITTDVNKKRKQFVFKVTWKVDDDETRDEPREPKDTQIGQSDKDFADMSATRHRKKDDKTRKEDKGSGNGKVAAAAVGGVVAGALTAGVGLLAGMMVVGMGAAGGGAAAALNASDGKDRVLVLATDSYLEAENWVNAIESQIHELGDNLFGLPNIEGSTAGGHKVRNYTIRPEVRLKDVEMWITTSKWKIFDVYEGIRLLQLNNTEATARSSEPNSASSMKASLSTLFADAKYIYGPPCMRANIGINASPADTFSTIINFPNSLKNGIFKSMRIVENIDNYTDIVHIKLEPVFLYPSWTAPRDFCVVRYWRDNFDGSYVICLDSTNHPECPLLDGHVRGELHAAYVVSPPRSKPANSSTLARHTKDMDDEEGTECLLSFIAQVNPCGWIWEALGYQNMFLKEIMLHVLDIRDAMDCERFQQVHFDPIHKISYSASSGGIPAAQGPSTEPSEAVSVSNTPAWLLSPTMWMDSNASTFRVRGATYLKDQVKAASGPAMFKFLGIDLYETPDAHKNIASHPRNRVNLALQRGDPSWMFVVNIMVPGDPYLCFVTYFLGNRADIEADTPFGRIARPFFNGNDDEFRNNRFKLIPKVVDGNLMVKMAVKDTPTLLGNKLKQYYFKGDNYFELDVDVGSSSVARNVCGLAIGYSKALVVDMGFCLQGNEESELPEVLMGCCSCYHVDMSTGSKL